MSHIAARLSVLALTAVAVATSALAAPPTGVARALEENVSISAITPSTGKLVFTFTIKVSSAIPTSTPIGCLAFANVQEVGAAGLTASYEETASVTATRSSATAATCTVNIPYSWLLATPASDTVNFNYSIGTVPATTTALTRSSSGIFASSKVPANGATTTKTLAVTI